MLFNSKSDNSSLNLFIFKLGKYIYRSLSEKYAYTFIDYNRQMISNIMYNEKTHLVSTFKESLILYDETDFLKRFYTKKESTLRLRKIFYFYSKYLKIYPNYTKLKEAKYLYLKIQRKQRLIDDQEERNYMNKRRNLFKYVNKNEKDFFCTDVFNSIINDINSENIEILFDINLNNINEQEEKFYNDINEKIGIIDKYIKEERESEDKKWHNEIARKLKMFTRRTHRKFSMSLNVRGNDITKNIMSDNIKCESKINSASYLSNNIHTRNSYLHKVRSNMTKSHITNNKNKNIKEKLTFIKGLLKHRENKNNSGVDLNNCSKPSLIEVNNNIKHSINSSVIKTQKHLGLNTSIINKRKMNKEFKYAKKRNNPKCATHVKFYSNTNLGNYTHRKGNTSQLISSNKNKENNHSNHNSLYSKKKNLNLSQDSNISNLPYKSILSKAKKTKKLINNFSLLKNILNNFNLLNTDRPKGKKGYREIHLMKKKSNSKSKSNKKKEKLEGSLLLKSKHIKRIVSNTNFTTNSTTKREISNSSLLSRNNSKIIGNNHYNNSIFSRNIMSNYSIVKNSSSKSRNTFTVKANYFKKDNSNDKKSNGFNKRKIKNIHNIKFYNSNSERKINKK